MDTSSIKASINSFIKRNRAALYRSVNTQSKLLELAAATGMAAHYASQGYDVLPVNPAGSKAFKVKTSSSGYPWNFSRFDVSKAGKHFEIHMNLSVNGAHDSGRYCVDVAVVKPGKVPIAKPKSDWDRLENASLITFSEVKKLNVYPMLLAQFYGIVHEIKPVFLRQRKPPYFVSDGHVLPALCTLGYLTSNSQDIVNAYPYRGVFVYIAQNYDVRLAKVKNGTHDTPFY